MFKKENVQFYVGAAVGVTVGLCVGKLLSPNGKSNNIANVQVYRTMDISSKDDNFSANKDKYRTRSRSASRYIDSSEKYSTFLTAQPLIKPALSDSNVNINSATLMKKMQLNKLSPICKSHQIVNKEENLSQDRNAYFFNGSCGHNNIEEKIIHNTTLYAHEKTISNNFILESKLESLDIKKNIPKDASLEYHPSDDFDRSNMAICNTIVDVKSIKADSPSTLNDCEFSDIEHYDEFSECNLISSTKYDISIQFT